MIEGVDIAVRYSIFGYLIGEGFRNVFKNKKSTIASLVIMCATMFVFGIFFAVSQNVNHITKTIEEQQGMEVFILDEATVEQKEELKNKIRSNQYVNTITEKSKEDALEEMKTMFKDRKSLWDTYGGDNNPFKASFIVTLTDLTKADEVKTEIESSSIISSVEIKSDTINALIKIADGINIITTIILVILVFISIFIITNTIKLTVHARRKEISIMKYVGAKDAFVKMPFAIEGVIMSLAAVLIVILIVSFCYEPIIGMIGQRASYKYLEINEVLPSLRWMLVIIGCFIGAFGSTMSMNKYLDV